MAIGRYRYKPSALKNRATALIADDLRMLGIPLDEDTVRRHIQIGVAEFPDVKTE